MIYKMLFNSNNIVIKALLSVLVLENIILSIYYIPNCFCILKAIKLPAIR